MTTDDPDQVGPVDRNPVDRNPVDPVAAPEEVAADRQRSRRSVTFIVSVVAAAVAVMVALALWVLVVPYEVAAPLGQRPAVDCATTVDADPIEVTAWEAACDRAEDDARTDRRNTAFVLGVGAFVVATAVSTWPSRRLTGERLGPLR